MGIINVTEARVSKLVGENGAFQVEEITLVNGQEWTKRYTVWSNAVAPAVDQYVNVSGVLSAKAREYQANNGDMKVAVDLNINEPRWQIVEGVGEPKPVGYTPSSLEEETALNEETPF